MESSDHKTPRPARSQRPRLLNTGAEEGADRGSVPSMLASLEKDGKSSGPAGSSGGGRAGRRVVPSIAALVVAGIAAFFGYRSFEGSDMPVASATLARPVSVPSAEALPKPVTVSVVDGKAAASTAVTAASASSPARIEAGAPILKAGERASAGAPSDAARAASGAINPLDKLAQSDAPKPASAAVPADPSKKPHGKDAQRPSGRAVASSKNIAGRADPKSSTGRKPRNGEEDADTELVAAMIARLDRRGAKPTSSLPDRAAVVSEPGLDDKVRECNSKTDLLDARRCRNRVCERYWGKVGVCPASRSPKAQVGQAVDRGEPG